MGLALGSLLHDAGVALHLSGRHVEPPPHPLFRLPASAVRFRGDLRAPEPWPDGLLLAVPDDALSTVSAALAETLPAALPVLHLSGSRDLDVLEPLIRRGCSVGSVHPLAAVASAEGGADRLVGAWYGVQGHGSALALAAWIVAAAEGRMLHVPRGGKSLYHTAAVFASGSVVSLLSVAERLMVTAGIGSSDARDAVANLAAGAVANARAVGPAAALTGPVRRGDVDTVRLHLAGLSGEQRRLYCMLAREALVLARQNGAAAAEIDALDALLAEER